MGLHTGMATSLAAIAQHVTQVSVLGKDGAGGVGQASWQDCHDSMSFERAQGYIARGGQILDASIVPVPKNRNTREENKAIKAGEEPEGWADKPAMRRQKDTDARWTRKHGKSHYGYKNHVNVDRQHKLVRVTMSAMRRCMTARRWITC